MIGSTEDSKVSCLVLKLNAIYIYIYMYMLCASDFPWSLCYSQHFSSFLIGWRMWPTSRPCPLCGPRVLWGKGVDFHLGYVREGLECVPLLLCEESTWWISSGYTCYSLLLNFCSRLWLIYPFIRWWLSKNSNLFLHLPECMTFRPRWLLRWMGWKGQTLWQDATINKRDDRIPMKSHKIPIYPLRPFKSPWKSHCIPIPSWPGPS